MIIKKFQGNTEIDAITKAKNEMGTQAIILNVKTIKPKGIMKIIKPVTVEVTAALEEKEPVINTVAAVGGATIQAPVKTDIKDEEKTQSSGFEAVANEKIVIRPPERQPDIKITREEKNPEAALEEKLDSLQQFIEEKLSTKGQSLKEEVEEKESDEDDIEKEKEDALSKNMSILKMIYNILIENEVDEIYANEIIEEIEKVVEENTHIDYILSNVYQKMILKFGRPKKIELSEKRPKLVFFVGPTGVGKTTTIAKLASIYKLEYKNKVAMLTADTYRIAAAEQLRTYANILDAPLSVIYSPDELINSTVKYKNYDLIFVDMPGHSHKNKKQQDMIKEMVDRVGENYDTDVFLVLSATTKYKDLKNIADAYKKIGGFSIIFTKLDETATFGNLLNLKLYTGGQIAYITNGQNVPEDVEVFNSQKIVKLLLGGKQ
ncbi:flagellar biosynthesis protein FlhF [Acetitomaculum ruminis DSM 5522]|uniref:Flagellar biosynthesis protein FlhF n=1 Tax=Acetitomaculum ruminis DSM 5522 TaxID=1120918 RepID=A0A1I0ZIL9_9FIRM|nr:flagellar biosynthesis protein FlhF [Acetitomaculum ruminis]SFB25267.1 flagellar biosynthesis protein FlhF [Acetitomaculum ruminis DSM 5522]